MLGKLGYQVLWWGSWGCYCSGEVVGVKSVGESGYVKQCGGEVKGVSVLGKCGGEVGKRVQQQHNRETVWCKEM